MHVGGRELHPRLHLEMRIERHQSLYVKISMVSPCLVVAVLYQSRHGVPPLPETRVAGVRHRSRLRSGHRSRPEHHRSNNYH